MHPVYSSSAHDSLEIAELLVRILHIQYDDFTPRKHYKISRFASISKKTPLLYCFAIYAAIEQLNDPSSILDQNGLVDAVCQDCPPSSILHYIFNASLLLLLFDT